MKTLLAHQTYETEIIKQTEIIIVNEVSMVSFNLFHNFKLLLEKFCRPEYTGGETFFGRRHVIFIGDFAQLPAIGQQIYRSMYFGPVFKFAKLQQVMRQTDLKFLEVLRKIRNNDWSDEVWQFLTEKIVKYAKYETYQEQVDAIIEKNSSLRFFGHHNCGLG